MTAEEFFDKQLVTDVNSVIDNSQHRYIRSEMILFAEAYYESNRKDHITAFAEWLKDNHSIEIHDMIIQDYLRYGG